MATLYSGGRIFDGKGLMLDDHGVLVERGRIESVAPAAQFSGFAGERVDTTGGTLMPGLIDCHVHILYGAEPDPGAVTDKKPTGDIVIRAMEHAHATLRGGTTAIRDCGGKDYLEFAVRDACNSGRFVGPTIRAAGRMICMTGGHGNRNGRVADGAEDVVRAVREQIHAGCDLVKLMATGGVMTPGVHPEDAHYTAAEIAAGISEAQRFQRTTASHAQGAEGILNATRGGITSIEHGIFMNEECIREMLARGTYLVATLSALVNIVSNTDSGIADHVMEKAERCADAHRRSVKAFYDAGGKLAMGTDAGTPFNRHGENAQELAYLVDVGVKPIDALTISTGNAADLMRLADRGTVADGMAADLLIVDGDPSQDIRSASDKRHHRMVVKNGRALEDDGDEAQRPTIVSSVAAT